MRARVLIIDDERLILHTVSMGLRLLGHEPLWASSGPRALELLDQHPVDVVLLDLRMPSSTGIEIWRQICQRPGPRPRGVLVTAAADGPLQARQNGLLFLEKPFGVEQLEGIIDEAMATTGAGG